MALLKDTRAHIFVDPAYFPGRCATIHYRPTPVKHTKLSELKEDITATLHAKKDLVIGELGVLHPSVLEKFEISFPCSAVEFSLEPFKKQMQKIWTNDD